jgi:hypothetical protein
MRYVIRKKPNGMFSTEPDDQLMERWDFETLPEALTECAATMRHGDTIEFTDDVAYALEQLQRELGSPEFAEALERVVEDIE